MEYHIQDFTEANYRKILQKAKEAYRFEFFGTSCTDRHALWRHDVDFSVHRALRLAEIEAEEGVQSTFFILLHSDFYHFMEPVIASKIRQIIDMGHQLGLHFDMGFYPDAIDQCGLGKYLTFERDILETVFSVPVKAFSFHNPDVTDALKYDDDIIAGMVNTYGKKLKTEYSYCSDSNGYWRHVRLPDLIEVAKPDYIHVLTHPAWWTPEAMYPRERIERCLSGRCNVVGKEYDSFLQGKGRVNVRS